jgi:putative oligomerization/nucleic acid binding protein
MGFLKGMRDLKGVSDHHGGMPSIRQSFKDIGSAVDDRGEREVMEKGTPAKAVAKGFAEPVPGDRFAMQILLEVHPPSGAPYEVAYVFPTTRMKAAITVGMEIPVKVHPEDPQRIAVQWDAQQASIAAAGGDYAAVTQGMQSTYGNVADQAMRDAQAKSQAEDPAEKLKKLGEMRDAGLITSEEFEAKKKDLLADL